MKTPTDTAIHSEFENLDNSPEQHLSVRADRGDSYAYASFMDLPETANLVSTVYNVHARSYLGEGFVSEEAITDTGALAEGVDKLRGKGIVHYLGYRLENGEQEACSTLRKKSLAPGQSIEDLPGYRQCADDLSLEVKSWLASVPAENLREIGSFGHTPEVSSKAGLELLRHVLQDSLGKNEVWFFTMVQQNVERLVRHFGPEAVRKVGDPVKLEDPRVNEVSLVPTVVDVDAFYRQVYETALKEENDSKRRHYMLSLINFTEGLDADSIGIDIYEAIQELKANLSGSSATPRPSENPAIDVAATISLNDVPKTAIFSELAVAAETAYGSSPEVWTPPIKFDMSIPEDRRRAMDLYESGAIQEVRSTALGSLDELFGLKNPGSMFDERSLREFIEAEQAKGELLGNWFYYPWKKALVQFLDKKDYQALRTSRNRVLWTSEEQERLMQPQVLIAGMSTGSGVLEQFLHNGVGGGFVLADFDTLDVTNLNRIHATAFDVGRSKVVTSARRVSEVDPYIDQVVIPGGIDAAALEGLEVKPAIIFDQVDDFAAKALLRVYARQHGIPLIMASDVGTTALIDVERYDTEAPKLFNGRLSPEIVSKMLAGELSGADKMKITTSLIGLSNASFRLLDSVVQKDELGGFPQRGTTASLGALSATEISADILLGRPVASGRRKIPLRKALGLKAEDDFGTRLGIAQRYIGQRHQTS